MAELPPGDDVRLSEHRGSCHCGAVRFTLRAPLQVIAEDCNCSICTKSAYLHLLVPAAHFTLECGADALRTYTFNTGVARHTFCAHCGVKPFYVPRSNPDGYSVNLHCVDTRGFERIRVDAFDGREWEQHAAALRSRTATP